MTSADGVGNARGGCCALAVAPIKAIISAPVRFTFLFMEGLRAVHRQIALTPPR
jgi:hypothetical protein